MNRDRYEGGNWKSGSRREPSESREGYNDQNRNEGPERYGRDYGSTEREDFYRGESGEDRFSRRRESGSRGQFDRSYIPDTAEGMGSYGGVWTGTTSGGDYGSMPQRSWSTQRRGSNEGREDYTGRGPKSYKRSDERIKEDINDALTSSPRIDAFEIECVCDDGEVTLSGFVATREEKRIAEDVAERVSGVKDVQNNLRVQKKEKGASFSPSSRSEKSSSEKSSGSTAAAYQQSKSRQQTHSGS